jgi:putative tricarboxylic transport membrane protein
MVAGVFALAACSGSTAAVPAWKPERPIEIVAQSAPGGGTDLTARLIQKILHDRRLIDVAAAVVNKPGGGGNVALAYLSQHPANGHYLQIATALLLTNHITGRSSYSYTDFTPLAQLNSEYVAFGVKTESPIKSGKDLLARLGVDAAALSIAVGTSSGGANHIAAALATRAGGGDMKKLKTVVFKSSAESATALLGGHVDLVTSSASLLVPHARTGALRIIAISAPRRGAGVLSTVPTWKEQGFDIVADNFRALIGPAGLNQTQIGYWDAVFAQLAQSEDWQKDLESKLWENNYMGSREARRYFESQYNESRRVLNDLGMAK